VRLTRSIENSATEDPYNETHGIKVQTRYETGNPHSYSLSSNPYRAATASQATNEESMGWTRSKSINTGKHSEVETFSGANLPAPWGTNTSSTEKVQTDIDGERTLVTDQSGKQRISKTNALGQLLNVWEVKDADADTEAVTFGTSSLNALKTSYQYDTLNNLITVNQGVQTRSFIYNSSSRLKSANNPESDLISYKYDENGKLTSKTDARSITTTYIYDVLNRVKTRSFWRNS
jgi:YD repeat-containing protein